MRRNPTTDTSALSSALPCIQRPPRHPSDSVEDARQTGWLGSDSPTSTGSCPVRQSTEPMTRGLPDVHRVVRGAWSALPAQRSELEAHRVVSGRRLSRGRAGSGNHSLQPPREFSPAANESVYRAGDSRENLCESLRPADHRDNHPAGFTLCDREHPTGATACVAEDEIHVIAGDVVAAERRVVLVRCNLPRPAMAYRDAKRPQLRATPDSVVHAGARGDCNPKTVVGRAQAVLGVNAIDNEAFVEWTDRLVALTAQKHPGLDRLGDQVQAFRAAGAG